MSTPHLHFVLHQTIPLLFENVCMVYYGDSPLRSLSLRSQLIPCACSIFVQIVGVSSLPLDLEPLSSSPLVLFSCSGCRREKIRLTENSSIFPGTSYQFIKNLSINTNTNINININLYQYRCQLLRLRL